MRAHYMGPSDSIIKANIRIMGTSEGEEGREFT